MRRRARLWQRAARISRVGGRQGEVLEAARPRRESGGNVGLLVRAAARAAPERQARDRRRGDRQEATRVAGDAAAAERGQARCAGAPGSGSGPRGSRAAVVVKAKFSKLLDHAENPAETLDYSYERQLELLQNVKRGIADVVTAKKRLELQETQLQQSVVKLDAQARQALAAGREDLARQALERKSGLQQQLQGLDQQAKQLEQQQEKLITSEKALSAKVEAFRTQKRSEEHTSELQSHSDLVCRLLLEKKKKKKRDQQPRYQ